MTDVSHSATDCPVCGGSQTHFFADKGGYSLSKCPTCTFIFVDPLPPSEVLDKQYTRDDEVHYPKAKVRLRRAMLKAARLSRYVWRKDVIDIACGGGFEVEAMRRFGADAVGLDINPHRVAYATCNFPKNRFYCEGYQALRNLNMKFDFVHSSQLLEHLPDVNDFMNVVSEIARPYGFVFIKTPDRDHWRVPQNLESPDVPSPPIRKQYFNKKNLTVLFERHGFKVKKFYFKTKPSLHVLARKLG